MRAVRDLAVEPAESRLHRAVEERIRSEMDDAIDEEPVASSERRREPPTAPRKRAWGRSRTSNQPWQFDLSDLGALSFAGTEPASPATGEVWYDSAIDSLIRDLIPHLAIETPGSPPFSIKISAALKIR